MQLLGHEWREGATIKKSLTVEPECSESQEQQRVIAWCHKQGGDAAKIFSIPNDGKRQPRTGRRMVAQGLSKGVPDLFLPVARYAALKDGGDSLYGLFIEMKRRSGGKLSPEQEDRIAELIDDGYKVEVCNGADEAIAAITRYLEEK